MPRGRARWVIRRDDVRQRYIIRHHRAFRKRYRYDRHRRAWIRRRVPKRYGVILADLYDKGNEMFQFELAVRAMNGEEAIEKAIRIISRFVKDKPALRGLWESRTFPLRGAEERTDVKEGTIVFRRMAILRRKPRREYAIEYTRAWKW